MSSAFPSLPLALLHPAITLDFLLILQVCAWCIWGVNGLASDLPDDLRARWRWFGAGALANALAISQTTLFAQITAYDRTAVRDTVYLAWSTLALLCWLEHGARLPGQGRRGARRWRIAAGVLLLAWGAACALGQAWTVWPWLGGTAALVLAAMGLARSDSLPLRVAYASFGALALLEWADPDTFFSWYASFTRDLALSWEQLDAFYPGPNPAAVNNGQLFMHVPGWVLALCVGAALVAWLGAFAWQKWAADRMAPDSRRSRLRFVIPIAAAILVFSGFLIYSTNMAAAAQIVSQEGHNRVQTIALSLADDSEASRLPTLAGQNRSLGPLRLVEVQDGRFHVFAGEDAAAIDGRTMPAALRAAFAGDSWFWFGPVREGADMRFYGAVPLSGVHSGRWLLSAQPYDYGGPYRRPMARSAALVITLLMLLGGAVLAYAAERERELRQKAAREQAEAAERSQTELLATLGHDVRTPLQSMLAYGELLASTPLDERQQALLAALREQTHGLHHLLQNLLHLGAAQLALPPRADRIELSALVNDLTQATEGAAQARGLRFTASLSPEAPAWVIGDDTRLRQILLNLLGNAVKYTAQGEVRLEIVPLAPPSALPGEVWLEFRIQDTGCGLSEEQRRRLFSLQIAPEASRGPEAGFGLGLPLVGKLSLLLGGAVNIEHTSALGTTISVRLPFRQPPATALSPAEARRPASSPPFPLRRLLLVDDHPVLRRVLAESLVAHGFELQTAATVAEACRLWREGCFEGALIDLGLPDGSGLPLAELFRETARSPVWLVALTAAAGLEAEYAALAAGFDAYVPKPVEPAALARTLRGKSDPASGEVVAALQRGYTPTPDTAAALESDWLLQLDRLDQAIAAREATAVVYLAHYLKSNALLARDRPGAAVLEKIEHAARARDWPAIVETRRHLREAGPSERES